MPRSTPPTTRRTPPALGWLAVVGLLAPALWWNPVSMAEADLMQQRGDVGGAAAQLARVGRWHPAGSMRVSALLRAATLAEAELGAPDRAAELLRQVLDEPSTPLDVQSEAWSRLGRIAAQHQDDPATAAEAYETAWRLDPSDPLAADRLVAAARARAETSDVDGALGAWSRVARNVPSLHSRAKVNQGSLLLAAGDPIAALDAYEDALAVTDDPTIAQVARLGAAACKERLGRLDDARDDITGADLPDDVAAERLRRLDERAEQL